MINPAIVFADEPTGALDSATAIEVMSILLAATTGRGRTLVARRCQRIVGLQDGRIVSDELRQPNGRW